MTESPRGRHRPAAAPPPAAKPPRKRASKRAVDGTIVLVVLAIIALVYVVLTDQADRRSDAAAETSAATTTEASSTSAAPLPEQLDAATRDAFFELTSRERGFERYYADAGNAPGLGISVCSQINSDATSDGVWAAARDLEDGRYAFSDADAWAFVSIATTVYCPEHEALVADTIASVTG